ncbi:kinase-like domain-containing protein [Rhodocollybia butyracea]|uniref:Kinase-like domain-containing protein n=1 Tax=Rhodocollybia butyracea TaxID=206335 RepID=A0A9P5PVQ7_9AGAR|nr:kinase-like domain-containing protein [Rhodocollybia butyracea]
MSDSLTSTKPSLWLPTSYQDLNNLPAEAIVYEPKLGGSKVVRTARDVVVKYRGDLAEEVLCLKYAQEKLSIRVPLVLYHPGDPHRSTLWDPRTEQVPQVWYICMEEIPGVQLKEVIETFDLQQLEHVALQIKAILADMRSVRATHLGSVSGGPFRNSYFFPHAVSPQRSWTSVSEFINHYHHLLMIFGTEEYADEALANFPRDSPIRFTHGDLVPRNILVDGSTITGIVDWSMAGFYPEFWEYCRMHEESEQSTGWAKVLDIVFPGPRRDNEIASLHRLMGTLLYNL